jgi:hypothetical protein
MTHAYVVKELTSNRTLLFLAPGEHQKQMNIVPYERVIVCTLLFELKTLGCCDVHK